MDFLKTLLCAMLSVVAIFFITKIMGHKQVAQLDFFDYISGITIGSIAAELATELEAPWKPLVALLVYGAISVMLSFFTQKFPKSRKYINGSPTVLLCGGKLIKENLKKSKLDLSEFLLLCREQGYFDLEEIETAVFEHNGRLSVLPKSASRPVTPTDLKIPVTATTPATELIMDGRVMKENLQSVGLDEAWLTRELQARGFPSVGKILLAVYQKENGKLTVYADNGTQK